jgi:two-component system, chemotaxis family, chemotaxis protein CheY
MHNTPWTAQESNGRSYRRMDDLRSMPILVVDDYQAMRRLLRTLLIRIGFANIDFAADGASALAKLRDHSHGLVISDMKMEPMSGLGLLREVRQDKRLRTVPFIMVTAAADVEEVVAAKKAGVSGYIIKPFTAETLRKKLVEVLHIPDGTASLAAE